MSNNRAGWHEFPHNDDQDETYNQCYALSHKVDCTAEAHDARIGMHRSHSDDEEWKGENPSTEIMPEITCQFVSSNLKI
jgi:hypothetical protein